MIINTQFYTKYRPRVSKKKKPLCCQIKPQLLPTHTWFILLLCVTVRVLFNTSSSYVLSIYTACHCMLHKMHSQVFSASSLFGVRPKQFTEHYLYNRQHNNNADNVHIMYLSCIGCHIITPSIGGSGESTPYEKRVRCMRV